MCIKIIEITWFLFPPGEDEQGNGLSSVKWKHNVASTRDEDTFTRVTRSLEYDSSLKNVNKHHVLGLIKSLKKFNLLELVKCLLHN